MKTMKIIVGLMLLLGSVVEAKEIVELNSKIKDVTVYLQGAQVHRNGSVKLKPGINEIVFRDIANGINTSSIQAGGTGDFIIMDVKYQSDYETVENTETSDSRDLVKVRKRMGQLTDSIVWIDFRIKDYAFQKEALMGEKNLILNNQLVKGQVDSFPILDQLTGFYRARIMDINKQLLEIEKKQFYDNRDKGRMNQELAELSQLANANPNKSTTKRVNKIIVTVNADNYVNGTVNVKYMVPSAGWTPLYDIRVGKTSDDVQLVYKANVFQNSGENWEGVKLNLATTNPNQRISKPNLYTFFVDFYEAYIRKDYSNMNVLNTRPQMAAEKLSMDDNEIAYELDEEVDKKESTPAAVYANSMTQVTEGMLHMEYSINLPYDVPSDGQYHMVYVQREKLKSEFDNYSVPKLDNRVYLLSKVIGLKEMKLIPGNSNIFFDGTYLGQTYIDPNQFKDTLDLSLGIEQNVLVKRRKLEEDHKDLLTSNKSIRTISYELKVKNNKSKSTTLNLLDQIPVSRQKEIEVALVEAEGAKFNKKTGILEWDLKLNPNEEKVIKLVYTVKYPKDKQLNPIA